MMAELRPKRRVQQAVLSSGAPVCLREGARFRTKVARSERFELPTLGFEVRCSIQLSYERVRGLDYQTWLDRASALPPGRSLL